MVDANKAAVLRAAEQALEQKNFPEVVKCCKQVLKQDRASYGAYVLLAKALQGTNHFPQAQATLRKALETDKSALPAWLALMDLHEADGEFEKFLDACNNARQITQASGDMKSHAACIERMASAFVKAERHEEALGAWQELLKDVNIVTPDVQLRALCGVIDAQAALLDLAIQQESEEHSAVRRGVRSVKSLRKDLETNLQFALQQPGLHVERHNALLLDLLLQTARESRGKESQIRLLQQGIATTLSSNVAIAFEVALVFCEEDNSEFLFQSVDIAKHMNKEPSYYRFRLGLRLAHLYPSHGLALATIAFLLRSSAARRVLCEKALRVDNTCVVGWQLLADLQIAEGAYSGAAESVNRGFQALEVWRSKYGLLLFAKELRLHLIQGHLHLATKNYEDAERLYDFVLEGAHKLAGREAQELASAALEGRAKVAIAQDDLKETEARIEALLSFDGMNHWALAELGWLVFKKGNIENAVRLLEQAVEVSGDNSTYRRRLGLAYWEIGERSGKERAVAQLVEAARLDPREAGVFRYLGHYYNQIAGDTRRAARSYQKAITIDPEDAEAGEALCNLLEQGGQIVLEGAICREASQHSPRAYWAWRRLGFIQVQAKQWSESVANLQHALRGFNSDGSLWEALGLAYQQLGMLTAALKAYERVVTLGNTSPTFSLLQSGIILLSLASYTQAIDMFRNAVEKVPGHVVAQCGLASALLGRARQCTGVGALAWAATLLQEAADVAHQCTANDGTVAAGWKLLGDIEVAYAQILPFDDMESTLDVNEDFNPLVAASFQHKVVLWHQQRKAASKRAERAYLHLLHICPQEGSVYGDLAMAMKLDLSLDQNIPGSTSVRLDPEIAVLSGLRLDATDADLWFIFGVLARHKGLKQHAFIQALRLDAYHSNAWAHLGQLYLLERELELARQAFDRSRSADPTLSLPWAGMAFLHSLSGDGKEMDEAFASCLYAVHLLPVTQVQLGLARQAERTHHLHSAQVYAATEQCVQRAPLSVEALNLKGLVCESRGSLSTAINAFQLARHIMKEGSGKMDSSAAKQRSIILLNLARVLCKAGRADDAVQVYEMLADLGTLLEEPEAMRSYAVAAWLGNKRELAAAIAKQAVELNGEPAAFVLYFRMIYWLSGPMMVLEEIRRASMDLFHNMIFSGTALAMAVAADHQQSVAGVLYRCNIFFDHERGPQAHQLVAAWKQGKQEEGHLYNSTADGLLKALHSFPDSLSIRFKLGEELMGSTYGNCANLALRCCYVPVPVATSQEALCISLVAALMADSADATRSALPQLVRWVHTEPWNKTAKSSLVLALQQMQKPNVHLAVGQLVPAQPVSNPESVDMNNLLKVCASNAVLERGDTASALQHAKAACLLNGSPECRFVASFQLVRCYLATQNFTLLRVEVRRCRQNLKPDDVLGHFKMSEMEEKLGVQQELQNSSFERAIGLKGAATPKVWNSLLHLNKAQGLLQRGDYISAEKVADQACAVHPESAPLHLFHGAICLTLSNFGGYTEHLASAVRSLSKAAQGGPSDISVAGVLLAQAEISRGNSQRRNAHKWEHFLRLSWKSWPAEDRPGELYYQMGLLAEQVEDASHAGVHAPESLQSKQSCMQRAVHVNPACFRYWATLQ